jgi:hypothetical protein
MLAKEAALGEKECTLCHEILPIDRFWKKGGRRRRAACDVCWDNRKKQLRENAIIKARGGETRTCNQCGLEKLKEAFRDNPESISGKWGICKDCEHERQREYDKRQKEERLINDRFCSGCNSVKKEVEFEVSRVLVELCNCCRKAERRRKTEEKHSTPEWIAEYKAKQAVRDRALTLRQYGLTEKTFQEILDLQRGRCAACGTDKPGGKHNQWHVDHCHNSGAVRGLLCSDCNLLESSGIDKVRSLLAYMEKFEVLYYNATNAVLNKKSGLRKSKRKKKSNLGAELFNAGIEYAA